MPPDVLTTRLAFFGRLANDLTRSVLRPDEMTVSVEGDTRAALLKNDGHFAFVDLEPSVVEYQIRLGGPSYQRRVVTRALPTPPVQVTYPGEDELYVALSAAPNAQNQVSFPPVTFVPPIEAGAAVLGESGFTTTLAEPLEGRDAHLATLTATIGLAAGQVLRIVRSPNVLLRPGPSYSFPPGVTVIAVHVVETGPDQTAVGAATLTITRIDGNAPTAVTVGGLSLSRFTLTAGPNSFAVLDADDRTTTTNEHGDAVFYFLRSTALANMQLTVAKAHYQTATVTLTVTVGVRNFQTVTLTPV